MNDKAETTDQQGWRPSPKLVAAVVVLILAVVFALMNTKTTTINVFFWDVSSPLWVAMVVLLVVGVAIGSIFPWGRRKD